MKDSFIGVFKSGEMIEKDNLTELESVPYVTHVFKKHSHSMHETPSGYVSHYWTYTPINFDGKKRTLLAGNFEIIDIAHDEGYRESLGRIITISENKGQRIHRHRCITPGSSFITKELFPLIEKLSVLGSWELFNDLNKLKQYENRIDHLNELVDKQKKEIQELKNEISNLKS